MKARKEGQKKSKRWEERMTKRKKNERSGDKKNEQTKEWRLRAGGREDDGPSPGGMPPPLPLLVQGSYPVWPRSFLP